jgi:hypothetical protein
MAKRLENEDCLVGDEEIVEVVHRLGLVESEYLLLQRTKAQNTL